MTTCPTPPTTTRYTPTIRPASTPTDWLEASALLHDYVEWLRAAAGVEPLDEQPALQPELADLPAHYDGARSELFVARLGPLAVGTVAIRTDDRGLAELKRLYLRPIARGSGLADRLVGVAVDAAAARGCHTVWLESLSGVMEPALAVYRRNGFVDGADEDRTIHLDGMVMLVRQTEPVPGDRTQRGRYSDGPANTTV